MGQSTRSLAQQQKRARGDARLPAGRHSGSSRKGRKVASSRSVPTDSSGKGRKVAGSSGAPFDSSRKGHEVMAPVSRSPLWQ